MIDSIKDELENFEGDYYRALSISKDEDIEMRLNREPYSCFVDNYFDLGLKAWQANMGIQAVFKDYFC